MALVTLLIVLGCGLAAPAIANPAQAPRVLTDEDLDFTAAGPIRIDLTLSASAGGPAADSSTQGQVTTAKATIARVTMDPSAPPSAQARLLGAATAEIGFGAGKADASGPINPTCSASAAATGDAAYVTQSRDFTTITATCSCTAFAVGVLSR